MNQPSRRQKILRMLSVFSGIILDNTTQYRYNRFGMVYAGGLCPQAFHDNLGICRSCVKHFVAFFVLNIFCRFIGNIYFAN